MATNLQTLRKDTRLVTPTRNVIRLVQRTGADWECEYTRDSALRGSVVLRESWLKAWCTVLAKPTAR